MASKSAIEKIMKAIKKSVMKTDDKESKPEKTEAVIIKMASKSETDKIIQAMKKTSENTNATEADEVKKIPSKEDLAENKVETKEPGLKKESAENVVIFTLTPFDELNRHSRITRSDSGYLINVTIPWSEIYYATDINEIQMKSGDRLGINVTVKDYDKDEKGNKELSSANTNLPLPKMILKNTLFSE